MQCTLLLYSTSHCHLCEQAQVILGEVCSANGITVREVEIADDEALLDRYGLRIPVVAIKSTGEELNWPFDQADVMTLLRAVKRESHYCE